MPLMSFSISAHIPLILSGAKKQTTRAPRKNPLKVGDKLYCYYKPRQKKGCKNCITTDACKIPILKRYTQELRNFPPCDRHNNFFGIAKITGILHFNNIMSMNAHSLDYETRTFKLTERWIDGFDMQPETFMEAWAKADGFSSLQEAHEYFMKATKNSQWMFLPWDVILFELLEKKCGNSEDKMKSIWSERDFQAYRVAICSENICSDCTDCTKTWEEIVDCYWDLVGDLEIEGLRDKI